LIVTDISFRLRDITRLHEKKEQLLEKELILTEVDSLTEKVKAQAAETRGTTLEVAQKVSVYQDKIKKITRTLCLL